MGLNDRGLGLKHICQHALYCFIVYELALGLRYDSNQRSTILQKGKSIANVYFVVPSYRCNFIWKAEAISCEHCRFVVCLHAPKSHVQRSRAYSLALYTLISVYTFSIMLPVFPKELSRRICFTIKSFLSYWSYPLFSRPSCAIQGWYCKEKLDASHP